MSTRSGRDQDVHPGLGIIEERDGDGSFAINNSKDSENANETNEMDHNKEIDE